MELQSPEELRKTLQEEITKYLEWVKTQSPDSFRDYRVEGNSPKPTANNNELHVTILITPFKPVIEYRIEGTNADGSPVTKEQWEEIIAELEAEDLIAKDKGNEHDIPSDN